MLAFRRLREGAGGSIMGAVALEARGHIMGMGICRRSVGAAAGLALLAAGSFTTSALAGAITDHATSAETFLQQGNPGEALGAFDQATDAFWVALPLQFRAALFASVVKGFGQYEPRADASFHSGDTAIVYLEPVGYGFTPAGSSFAVAFTTGIEISTVGGILLAKADDFGRLEWNGRSRSREVHAAVNVTLPTFKPGDYRLKLTLTDAATAKQASVTLPFTIASRGPGGN